MSVTKQEAQFLKGILAKHLDDYVEELVRGDKPDQAMKHMQENRQAGLDLISKVEDTIRRAARAGNSTYFTNSWLRATIFLYLLHNRMFYDEEEKLEKVIVDITSRSFTLISDSGDTKRIECNAEQFMRVLDVVRNMLTTEEVTYV